MYEDQFDLTDAERAEVREVLTDMAARGERLTDAAGRPIPFRPLRGRRFLVCDKGLLWRHAPEGSPQPVGRPGAALRRNSAVEMWTGRWRKVRTPDGRETYAKCLVWVPLDEHVNGHSGISKLAWYLSRKGFKHPHAAPHAPGDEDIAALAGRKQAAQNAVLARMQAEGLAAPAEQGPPAPPAPPAAPEPAGRQPGRHHHSRHYPMKGARRGA
ncbi:MAG TPA: hypothetical protein VM695_06125 [Phycisphaerae bacterium]|nr:hypothetical protein [Phycisphaerae bacterium]